MEEYELQCACGESISVGIHKCGLDVPCPKCHAEIRVPEMSTLKTLNGDPYPTFRYIQKIECATRDRIKPFDGSCVACGSVGTNEVPIVFSELAERIINDDGGIRPGMLGIHAVVGKAESVFQTTNFPMILCDQCTQNFKQSRPSSYLRWSGWILLTGIVAAVFQIVFQMWIVSILATLVVCGNLFRFRGTGIGKVSKIPRWLQKWVQHIRWFPEATREAMEFEISVGKPHPI